MNDYTIEYLPPALEGHVVATLWAKLHDKINMPRVFTTGADPLSPNERELYETLTVHLRYLASALCTTVSETR